MKTTNIITWMFGVTILYALFLINNKPYKFQIVKEHNCQHEIHLVIQGDTFRQCEF